MKKSILILLACAALLLAGCRPVGNDNGLTPPPGPAAETAAPARPTPAAVGALGENAPKFIPLCEGAYLVQPDLDLELYWDLTGGSGFVRYELLSKQKLDAGAISVSFTELTCWRAETEVGELHFNGESCGRLEERDALAAVSAEDIFTYPLYLCCQNADWSALAALAEDVRQCRTELERLKQQGADADAMLVAELASAAAEAAFWDAYDAERDAYYALTAADLPRFYYYYIDVSFAPVGEVREETAATAVLSLGEERFSFSTGKLHLLPEAPFELGAAGTELENSSYCLSAEYRHTAYRDGYRLTEAFMLFPAPDPVDITFERFSFYREEDAASDLRIRLGSGMDFTWDGCSPLTVSTGESLEMELCLKSPNLLRPNADCLLVGLLDYRCGEREGTAAICFPLQYRRTPYELYEECFDGVDLEAYYEVYFALYADRHGVGAR